MGIVKTRRCDVTGTALNVKSYELELTEVRRTDCGPYEDDSIEPVEILVQRVIDLSPNALKRLRRYIETGTTPVKSFKRKKPDEQEAPEVSPAAEAG